MIMSFMVAPDIFQSIIILSVASEIASFGSSAVVDPSSLTSRKVNIKEYEHNDYIYMYIPIGESIASKLLTLVLETLALASALSCNT